MGVYTSVTWGSAVWLSEAFVTKGFFALFLLIGLLLASILNVIFPGWFFSTIWINRCLSVKFFRTSKASFGWAFPGFTIAINMSSLLLHSITSGGDCGHQYPLWFSILIFVNIMLIIDVLIEGMHRICSLQKPLKYCSFILVGSVLSVTEIHLPYVFSTIHSNSGDWWRQN